MNKVLLFGGTGEGRALAEWMVARDIPHTVCVATEYGETLLPAGAEAHVGRMDSGEMEALMRAGGYSLAVDATHPYAVEVTEHIKESAKKTNLPYLRLSRSWQRTRMSRPPRPYSSSVAKRWASVTSISGDAEAKATCPRRSAHASALASSSV